MNIRITDTLQIKPNNCSEEPHIVFFLRVTIGDWEWLTARSFSEISAFHTQVVVKKTKSTTPALPDGDADTIKSGASGYLNELVTIPALEEPLRKWIGGTTNSTQCIARNGEISKEGSFLWKKNKQQSKRYGLIIGETLYVYEHSVKSGEFPIEVPISIPLNDAKITSNKQTITLNIPDSETKYELEFESENEQKTWTKALQEHPLNKPLNAHNEGNLTLAQQQAVSDLQVEFPDIDRATLVRFLEARSWIVDQAAGLLKADLIWRKEMRIEHLTILSIYSELKNGKILFPGGVDKEGRPILILRARLHHPSTDFIDTLKLAVYYFELVCSKANKNGEVAVLIDLDGFDKSHTDFRTYKLTLELLLAHYPGRVGVAVCVSAPWYFRMVYKVVKPWLGADLLSRVSIYSGISELKRYADPDQLLPEYGGTLQFNYKDWVQERAQIDGVSLADAETEKAIHVFENEEIPATYSDAPTSRTQEGAQMTGWMKKQGGFVRKFNKRYCVLKGSILYYYRGEKDIKAEGVVPLRSATLAFDQSDVFHLITMGGKDCVFQLADKKQRQWLTELEKSVLQYGGRIGNQEKASLDADSSLWDTYRVEWAELPWNVNAKLNKSKSSSKANKSSKSKTKSKSTGDLVGEAGAIAEEVSENALGLFFAMYSARTSSTWQSSHVHSGKAILDWAVSAKYSRSDALGLLEELFFGGFLLACNKGSKAFFDSEKEFYSFSFLSGGVTLNLLQISNKTPHEESDRFVEGLIELAHKLVKNHTENGEVNLSELRTSREFFDFQLETCALQNLDLERFVSQADRAKVFCNLRSLLFIHSQLVGDLNGNVKSLSLDDLKTRHRVFSVHQYLIGNVRLSVDDLFHGILRGNQPVPLDRLSSSHFDKKDFRAKLALKDFQNDPRLWFLAFPQITYSVFEVCNNFEEFLQSIATSFIQQSVKVNGTELSLPFLYGWTNSTDQGVLKFVSELASGDLKKQVESATSLVYTQVDWKNLRIR